MSPTAPPRLYTVAEVAQLLGGVGQESVRRWIRDGKLGTVDLDPKGRRGWRISAEQLQRFIDERSS